MKSKLDKAVEYIRGNCQKHSVCDKCVFYDNAWDCQFKDGYVPAEWKTPEEIREERRKR